MARVEANQALQPSIIDRLIDPDSGGTSWRRGYSVEQMTVAVRRDLEDLLNTRRSSGGIAEEREELHNSIVGYGLPDLVSLNAITAEQRREIGALIEDTISRFEPRLKDVRATLIGDADQKERSIRFHVDARLTVDPCPEVAFDTVLQLSTGQYSVTEKAPS
jgi:type VI secretion system protein ImpF